MSAGMHWRHAYPHLVASAIKGYVRLYGHVCLYGHVRLILLTPLEVRVSSCKGVAAVMS